MHNNVFISWSGERSHEAALALKDWLPSVIQNLNPYVSSEDISKGARWSDDVAKNLEQSGFGILCLTPENRDAPWILFEAGALSKMVDSSRVVPILIGLKRTELFQPLSQFQSVVTEKSDILKLMKGLNTACGDSALTENLLTRTFEQWWPELEKQFAAIEEKIRESKAPVTKAKKEEASLENVVKSLDELIATFRANQDFLRNPELILPPEYLLSLLRQQNRPKSESPIFDEQHPVWRDISRSIVHLRVALSDSESIHSESRKEEIKMHSDLLINAIEYVRSEIKDSASRDQGRRLRARNNDNPRFNYS